MRIQTSEGKGLQDQRKIVASMALALVLLSGAAFALCSDGVDALEEGDYSYTVLGNPAFATVTSYIGAGGDITVPSTLGGYPVTHIGIDAFDYMTTITSVTLPDSIESIDDQAFQMCTSLTSVTFGSGLKVIKGLAFNGCSALTTITVPDGVTLIGDSSFSRCTSLTSVTLGTSLTTIGGSSFYACSSLTSITFRGLTSPTSVGSYWILDTNPFLKGYANAASNFPAAGSRFYGLLMAEGASDGAATLTLSATAGNQTVDLTWNVPSSGGPYSYHLFRDGVEIWTGSSNSYTDADVTKDVGYTYYVTARNALGAGPNSTELTVIPFGVPAAPEGLTCAQGDGHNHLTWDPVSYSGPGTLSYHLFRDGVEIYSGPATMFDDLGLVNGNEHSYYVTATNDVGWGEPSVTITATPSASGSGSGSDMTPVIVLVIVAAVGVVGALLYLKRRK